MTGKTMLKFEKEIYEKLEFPNEICRIRLNYNDDGLDHSYFKLNEVKSLLKTLECPYKYDGENSHTFLLKKYDKLSFKISFL